MELRWFSCDKCDAVEFRYKRGKCTNCGSGRMCPQPAAGEAK